MPYTKFRYIAYQVPTATQNLAVKGSKVESGFAPGTLCPAIARIPIPGGIANDANIRLHRLAAIVDLAKTALSLIGDDDNTLKVFMAPEFYFRPPTSTGGDYTNDSYPRNVMAQITNAFDTMFQHKDFAHWLIVPGTVIWNSIDMDMKSVYLNTAAYIRGGVKDSPLLFVEKQLASSIDGLPQGDTPGVNPDYIGVYESWGRRKQRAFEVGGVDLGLEICLDHADNSKYKTLKRVLNEWTSKEGAPQKEVALHLLTAGGMPIQQGSVAAKVNGYILRTDGFANAPQAQMQKVTGYTNKTSGVVCSADDLNGKAALTDVAPEHTLSITSAAKLVPMKTSPPYYKFDQKVFIYPAKNLP